MQYDVNKVIFVEFMKFNCGYTSLKPYVTKFICNLKNNENWKQLFIN
jgi:hypothetical protein